MASEELPKVSIIVAARNSADTIGECLRSLFEQNYPLKHFEVLVMDGCSTDDTVKIAECFPAQVFSLPFNAPAAYNYALKFARFPVVGFVDADAKVERNWLLKLVVHLGEPTVAGVSGGIETWNFENLWARSIGYELKVRYRRLGAYTGRIATMNLLLKRSVIEEVGGWDETFPSQYDTDFGFRLSQRGYKIAYVPEAKCFHLHRGTLGAYWRQQLQYGKNTLRLYFKHGRLARGDEITDFGMNIQPLVFLVIFSFAFLGIWDMLRFLWLVAGGLFVITFVYFVVSAVRVSLKFRDWSAMRLVVLYFVRAFAWLSGAALAALSFLRHKRRLKKQ
ncbi:MAG: glycosyltransferase [Candidatus Bathyarchaeota archaeon]|nr:glycosyltransferase [Candidatus Bathyarchaeota archaeon]